MREVMKGLLLSDLVILGCLLWTPVVEFMERRKVPRWTLMTLSLLMAIALGLAVSCIIMGIDAQCLENENTLHFPRYRR